jgi:hypothetical protein
MQVAIRVNGGTEIGYGHLVRSAALAVNLLARDNTVTVATTTPERLRRYSRRRSTHRTPVKKRSRTARHVACSRSSRDRIHECARSRHCISACSARSRPLAVPRDDLRHTIYADLFINGTCALPTLTTRSRESHPNHVLELTTCCCGERFGSVQLKSHHGVSSRSVPSL